MYHITIKVYALIHNTKEIFGFHLICFPFIIPLISLFFALASYQVMGLIISGGS